MRVYSFAVTQTRVVQILTGTDTQTFGTDGPYMASREVCFNELAIFNNSSLFPDAR